MMEKVVIAKSRTVDPAKTTICCTRYGNVMASRGSVIPRFVEQIKAGKPLTITEPAMTRFIMSLEEAVELVVFAFEHAENGDIMVQKAPACTIETLAEAVKELFNPEAETKIIGIRHGEKMYETLLTKEECAHAEDMGNFFRVPCDKRDLNYEKYFDIGQHGVNDIQEFNSMNTDILDVEAVRRKLLALPYIKHELAEWGKDKMKYKLLILGATGMAGHTISMYMHERGHDVTGFDTRPITHCGCKSVVGDARNIDELTKLIQEEHFDAVINCIGILNQFAEEKKELAVFLNSYLPHFLAGVTSGTKTKIIHMSTDCVFSGKKENIPKTISATARLSTTGRKLSENWKTIKISRCVTP